MKRHRKSEKILNKKMSSKIGEHGYLMWKRGHTFY